MSDVRTGNFKLRVAIAADGRKNYVLAQAIGIRASDLSGFKTGALTPTVEVQHRIAEVLNVPVDELFADQVNA